MSAFTMSAGSIERAIFGTYTKNSRALKIITSYQCFSPFHLLDYIFVDKKEFEAAIKRNEFVEYAVFSGNYYGTR